LQFSPSASAFELQFQIPLPSRSGSFGSWPFKLASGSGRKPGEKVAMCVAPPLLRPLLYVIYVKWI